MCVQVWLTHLNQDVQVLVGGLKEADEQLQYLLLQQQVVAADLSTTHADTHLHHHQHLKSVFPDIHMYIVHARYRNN